MLLAEDFGDAPDTGAGTGARNYDTLLANNGPRHTIVAGLRLGGTVDGEADASVNGRATGDDIGADDEDGVAYPATDLVVTIGSQPSIGLRATNTTLVAATLSGWIDFDNNGLFDNTTERAQTVVPAGTNNGAFSLTFPVVPTGFTGTTFARFRLSTDVAGQSSLGAASNGEVEDYAVTIVAAGDGTVKPGAVSKIGHNLGGGPSLTNFEFFGRSLASLGDFDGDGIGDMVIGSFRDDTGGTDFGAVHITLMNADGTAKSRTKIAHNLNGGPSLNYGGFGFSAANIGDLDGDGVTDIAVGAPFDNVAGLSRGVVHILRLNADGTVKTGGATRIDRNTPGLTLLDRDYFGVSVTGLGDLDGDGVADIAVGARGDDTGGAERGAFYIVRMNANGTVKTGGITKVDANTVGGPVFSAGDEFGETVEGLRDIDGDGIRDLAVGALRDDTGGTNRGAVHVLRLNANGTIKGSTKIASGLNGGPTLVDNDSFGTAIADLGDLDGDGITDIAVTASDDDTGGNGRGAFYIVRLNANGSAKSTTKIAHQTNGGPTLADADFFGSSITGLGDIDGDGAIDIAVGAVGDDGGGTQQGAVHVLRMAPSTTTSGPTVALSGATVAENASLGTTVGTLSVTNGTPGDTYSFGFVAGAGGDDNGSFTIVGNQLRTNTTFNLATKGTYTVRVAATNQASVSVARAFTITVTAASGNSAPVLNTAGDVYYIAGVGRRISEAMTNGVLVSDLLARGAGGDPISDGDAGALEGIAVTAIDKTYGRWQYTTAANPTNVDWTDIDAGGEISDASALLLNSDATTRVRMISTLVPHHEGTVTQGFLPLESKLTAGLSFRAWDRTSGGAGQRGNAVSNGGGTAFSTATETVATYFEARLWRSFNTNALLNVYTLEAEFFALTANPTYQDRSFSQFSGFSVFLSPLTPSLGVSSLYRMYYGVQYNADRTETDMGYRYLTTNLAEAQILENQGPADKRQLRQGTYFRELGVNAGTSITGYVFSDFQPGTNQFSQIYRTDLIGKPTRPPGTAEGSPPTTQRGQEIGDHVYTTSVNIEIARTGVWRVESTRGFVRELSTTQVSADIVPRTTDVPLGPDVNGATPGTRATMGQSVVAMSAIAEVAPRVEAREFAFSGLVATVTGARGTVGESAPAEPQWQVVPRKRIANTVRSVEVAPVGIDRVFGELATREGIEPGSDGWGG
jgi:hypothetical protein